MLLLQPREGLCPMCAVKHKPDEAHNCQSLQYQYWFFGTHKRWPTWADAIAHCTPEVQALWKQKLIEINHWSEPEKGEPIASPLSEYDASKAVEVGTKTVIQFEPEGDE